MATMAKSTARARHTDTTLSTPVAKSDPSRDANASAKVVAAVARLETTIETSRLAPSMDSTTTSTSLRRTSPGRSAAVPKTRRRASRTESSQPSPA